MHDRERGPRPSVSSLSARRHQPGIKVRQRAGTLSQCKSNGYPTGDPWIKGMKKEVIKGDIKSEERDQKKEQSPGQEESRMIQKGMASIVSIL
jgi:hypothetical protein